MTCEQEAVEVVWLLRWSSLGRLIK